MTTISVPLTEELLKGINGLIKEGKVSNKAEAIRQAIKKYLEDEAVHAILEASKEPDLEGDLDILAKKLS